MFTNWKQVEDWILDNGLVHWVFYKNNPEGRDEKANDKIVDSNHFTVSDQADKLAMTKKYLQMAGGRAYGVGFKTPNTTIGGIICDVRLEQEQPQQTAGIAAPQQYDIDGLRDSIMKEVRAEYEQKEYERKRAELDRDQKEFEKMKNSAIGLLVNHLAPVAQAFMASKGARVAGVDSAAPVIAQPVQPIVADQEEVQEDVFTDEEADKLFALMARFKAVEPQYMQLIESVVTMAENGDATYNMAKGFLIK